MLTRREFGAGLVALAASDITGSRSGAKAAEPRGKVLHSVLGNWFGGAVGEVPTESIRDAKRWSA